jgi:acylphosphatase
MSQTVRITVSGKVQQVWYRKYTLSEAKRLEVTGTVQNMSNGNVEIMATGTDKQIAHLIAWAWLGSPRARVTNLQCLELEELVQFQEFKVLND